MILVGAGATLAEALPRRPARSMRPPLDRTFFDLCRSADLRGGDVVRRYMRRHFGLDPYDGYPMEAIFNFLYSDVFSSSPPPDALDAYWALLEMYSAGIARTTNPLNGTARTGVGELLRTIWELDRDITFVTFNQDLVIEKALEAASDAPGFADIPWNISTCYRREFDGFLFPTQGRFFLMRGDLDIPDPSVPILKLHGSLNWVWRTASREDARNSIPRPGTGVYCLTARDVEGDLILEYERDDPYLVPLVVPPIYEKGPHYRDFLGPLWTLARQALVTADRLVVFGYSFPTADFSARALLRASFHEGARTKSVSVIDADPSVASLMTDFLDLPSCLFFRDVGAFGAFTGRDN